jgi:type II secretion system protein H
MTLVTGNKNKQRCTRGFTLVELILVMVLLVIVTSLIAPAMANFIRGRALDAEARRLYAILHAGQSRAVSEGMPIVVWVDEKGNYYGMEEETPGKSGDLKKEVLPVDSTLKIEVVSLTGGVQTSFNNYPDIRFLPDGTIDESSPQALHLTHADGGDIWLVEARNRMGYEVSNTQNLYQYQ